MTDTIEAGKLVKLVADDFEGQAGLQGSVLAYIPNRHGAAAAPGGTLQVDDAERRVIAVEKSAYVERMVLVTIE